MKTHSPTNYPSPLETIYISQLLKTNSLSETTVSQAQPGFICSNSNSAILIDSRIKCEICSKLTIEAPDVVLVSLFSTLNILYTFF